MDDNIMFIFIVGVSLLIELPIFFIIGFYNKINISDIYKKILILGLILLYISGISTIIILENLNSIQNYISKGNYEIFLLLIPIIVLLGYIIFYLIKLSLGKIDIKIYGNKFTSGDKLTGDINIELKKDIINSTLYVYLRGYKYVGSGSNRSSSGSRQKKYEDKIILEKDAFFKSNYVKNYNFSFDIPYNNKNGEYDEYDKENLTDEQKQKLIQMTNIFLKITGFDSGEEYLKLWKIEVKLEKKGIDLSNQKVVDVVRILKNIGKSQ